MTLVMKLSVVELKMTVTTEAYTQGRQKFTAFLVLDIGPAGPVQWTISAVKFGPV